MTTKLFVVAAALASVIAPAMSAQTQPPVGEPVPTFSKDVAPILFANCTTCHRPGEIAPMSLLTFKDARPWARSIATQVKTGAMPPWHADPTIGEFANARRLTEAQKSTIARWADAGAPEGDSKDLPATPHYAEGWSLGEPDVILSMQEDYPIPATGTVPYRYFEVPANFAEDRWIKSWEMRPGNRLVVHHVIVSVRPPAPTEAMQAAAKAQAANPTTPRPRPVVELADGMDIPDGQTGGRALPESQRRPADPNDRPRPRGTTGSIGGYVPGNATRVFPEGTAMRLPAGSSLVFQMHYTPIGEATTDRTRLGLTFAKEPPKVTLASAFLINGSLHIPAGAANHQVDADATINRDILLWSLVPHTHMRGKRWKYEAIFPDGRRETILSVPNYDFEWQHEYLFREPLKLPKDTKIHATAWYDNSTANNSNPDPKAEVWWGDQTWEEMMFTALTYSVVGAPSPSTQKQ
jgi:hypothetical protein